MLRPFLHADKTEAGCDEAGRGCLAGPVFAAAVILPKDFENKTLNDSKQLSEKQRKELRPIIEKEATAWAVQAISPKKIDEINILNASILGMQLSVEKLKTQPNFLLIDGNRFKPFKDIPFECIKKGDAKFMSIAAASVLAKTYRDDYMENLHKRFPHYNWAKNKGYPTKEHRAAIEVHGVTKHHRRSFRQLPETSQLELFG